MATVLLLLCLTLACSAFPSSLSLVNNSELDWKFHSFPTQPDFALLASLINLNNKKGKIVAYTNSPSSGSADTPGVTWEASTLPNARSVQKGGNLIWSKKTDLLGKTPPSRIHSDAAIMTWNPQFGGLTRYTLHAVIMFGGLTTANEVLGDTWVYTETTAQTSWSDESSRVGAVGPSRRYGHALASVGFSDPGAPFVVMFGGANHYKKDPGAKTLGDTWVLASVWNTGDGSTHSFEWQNVAIPPGNNTSPPRRYKQAMASHGQPTNGKGVLASIFRSVMFGGCADVHCKTLLSDTWIFASTPNMEASVSPSTQLLSVSWSWKQIKSTGDHPSGRR